MACESCEKENETIKLFEEFSYKLRDLINEYNLRLGSGAIASALILESKVEMCCSSPCFYHMLGYLNTLLHHPLF